MKGKIHEHPKANSNGFDKNPQNINKSGQNASLMKSIMKKLRTDSDYIIIEEVEILDDNGNPSGQVVKGRISVLNSDAIVQHYIKRSKKSDRVLLHLVDNSKLKGEEEEDDESYMKYNPEVSDLLKQKLTKLEIELLALIGQRMLIKGWNYPVPNYLQIIKNHQKLDNKSPKLVL